MFIYEPRDIEKPTFAPNFDSAQRDDNAARQLRDATYDLQVYRDNASNEWSAKSEAYDRRNRAIFEATGVQLDNPMVYDVLALKPVPGAGGLPESAARDNIADQERNWLAATRKLAAERPEFAGIIGAERPIADDAYAITRGAEKAFAEADKAAGELGTLRRAANMLAGGALGMTRDPIQVAALFAGGFHGPARTVAGRIFSMMFTEAAVNAGVEGAVQVAAQDYKRRAGVEHGLSDALQQVGIAALFGGGFGGLLQGGAEVLRLTGKSVPESVLRRAAQGTPDLGDAKIIAESLGLQIDPAMARVADIAAEQPALDRAAFGRPPAGLSDADADALAARTIRAIEDPADTVPDPQARFETLERIAREQQPLGAAPRKPVSLMQFLSSRAVGGIVDHGGELTAMGLSRKFVPGGGALVRAKGKSLDMAREAAAEAGYFDGLYGNPERATAESTVDDLLRLLRQEAGGEPAYSARNDGGRQFDQMDCEQREKAQQAYRNMIGRIDSAAQSVGLDAIDDAIIVRAAGFVDNETDELAALERALEEDYRNFADAAAERGDEAYDDSDLPFFDEPGQDTRAVQDLREPAGRAGDESAAGRRGADAADGEPLPRAGGDEGSAGQPLRAAGDTPEPGSPEAGELAETTLLEARGVARSEAADADLTEQSFYRPPHRTLDEIYAVADDHQASLEEAGNSISSELGIEFKTRGIKKRETSEAKIGRKGYDDASEITDIVRGGFVVSRADDAEKVIQLLGQKFDLLDEGWSKTLTGYVDRKVLVRFDDGTIGEVQIWDQAMLAVRKEGHKLYKEWRELDPRAPQALKLLDQMNELHAAAAVRSSVDWSIEGGVSGPKVLKRSRQAGSDMRPAVSATSQKSTLTQSDPGLSMAQASEAPSTAGRPSQLANRIADSSDTNIAQESAARQQPDAWDAIPDGHTADGEVSHVTHAQLVEDAERDGFFGDLIASCKD